MCTRLNNTRSLIDLLPLIEDTSKQMCFGCNVNGISGQDGKIIWPDSSKCFRVLLLNATGMFALVHVNINAVDI